MNDLKRRLEKKRGKKAQEISVSASSPPASFGIPFPNMVSPLPLFFCSDDISRAIKKLKTLGGGFDLFSVGSQKLVQSVPLEMNMEYTAVLALAQGTGFISISSVIAETKWDRDRAQRQLVSFIFPFFTQRSTNPTPPL